MSSTPTGNGSTQFLVGVAVRAHGLHGEVVVEVRTDSPEERFTPGTRFVTSRTGSPAGRLTIETARPHSGRMLVRFVETADRDAAEALRGTLLLVGVDDLRGPEDPEEFHVHQLAGLQAELMDGTVVGTVREVVHGPGGELLLLTRPELPDALVPFVHAIVPTVDLAGGRVVLTPPDGLLDSEQPGWSGQQIAGSLRVSKQAVHKKYSRLGVPSSDQEHAGGSRTLEQFTAGGRDVVVGAERDARARSSDTVRTQHVLAALVRVPDTVAMTVLSAAHRLLIARGLQHDAAKVMVEELVRRKRAG